MKNLTELIETMSAERPSDWDALPDIELYRDQVLSYMKRQHSLQPEENQLTGAMINNYIKSGLLPRANGKKYVRDHLAYLTAIACLKQVLSVGETDFLLKHQPDRSDTEFFYNRYLKQLDESFSQATEQLQHGLEQQSDAADFSSEELASVAMGLAVSAYTQKLACEKILEIIKERETEKAGKKSGETRKE